MKRIGILATTIVLWASPIQSFPIITGNVLTPPAISGVAVFPKKQTVISEVKENVKTRKKPIDKPRAKIETFKVTAYCPCEECSCGYGRQTATGHTARAGHTIAVDPTVIPYGAHVKINGMEYVAEDCGGGGQGECD